MITRDYVTTMAAYNRWQNENLYGAAQRLDDGARRADRGAFFGSIFATLNHILWADQIWMSRFTGGAPPQARGVAESLRQHDEWDALCATRERFDDVIADWAAAVDATWLGSEHTWFSGSLGRQVSQPRWLLVVHMFNHQTHHRGQVHAMLTAAGQRPGDTDLPFMGA